MSDSDFALRLASPAERREMVQTLTRERDEARAEAARLRGALRLAEGPNRAPAEGDAMTPRERIKMWRRRLEAGFLILKEHFGEDVAEAVLLPPSETLLLLDVAEAAARHIEEKFSDPEAVPCDLGPEECSACNLEQALARLGEGE